MCHGCVYTSSFVLDYHALYFQLFMSIEQKSHIELFRKIRSENRGSGIENRESGMEDRSRKLENKINEEIVDRNDVDRP